VADFSCAEAVFLEVAVQEFFEKALVRKRSDVVLRPDLVKNR
jgi:hypothetical protein